MLDIVLYDQNKKCNYCIIFKILCSAIVHFAFFTIYLSFKPNSHLRIFMYKRSTITEVTYIENNLYKGICSGQCSFIFSKCLKDDMKYQNTCLM